MTDISIKEPLTYRRDNQTHSYFRDLWLSENDGHGGGDAARKRLDRHGAEMRAIHAERDKRALSAIRAGEFQYEQRVEPNRTDGYGGYLTVPEWLEQMFVTALRPSRVLAGLTPRFDLPLGVSSVNLPIIGTGTATGPVSDTAAVPEQDISDSAGTSTVVSISGQADVPLQLLEQSPAGASLDVALLTDLSAAYDASLETQLLYGGGTTQNQLAGITTLSGITSVTYTDADPTGSKLWGYLAQAAGQLGDLRKAPAQAWLMRSARWFWLQGSTDTSGLPFGLSPAYLGNDASTPWPVGGLMGLPSFLNESVSAVLGGGGNQDEVICLRPTDTVLFESAPTTNVFREPLSGSLGARIQLHARVAAITRHVSSVATVGGTGLVVASGY